jgi:hypothetical protein
VAEPGIPFVIAFLPSENAEVREHAAWMLAGTALGRNEYPPPHEFVDVLNFNFVGGLLTYPREF